MIGMVWDGYQRQLNGYDITTEQVTQKPPVFYLGTVTENPEKENSLNSDSHVMMHVPRSFF